MGHYDNLRYKVVPDAVNQEISSENAAAPTENNGGDTSYYALASEWESAQDIIEARNMNFAQGNIFKAAFTFNVGRHDATNYERELNKIEWFVQREKERIRNGK